jgi:fatty acid desaturase
MKKISRLFKWFLATITLIGLAMLAVFMGGVLIAFLYGAIFLYLIGCIFSIKTKNKRKTKNEKG